MPWKNWTEQEVRLRFVYAVQAGTETMSECCRRYQISRKTGYKWLRRYTEAGLAGLSARSRRRKRAGGWSGCWRQRLLVWRRRRPTWGARKLQDKLRRFWPAQPLPAVRTFQRWLAQAGVTRRARQRARPGPRREARPRLVARQPNDVWTVDFKGAGRRGGPEPLTVFDLASRYGLAAQLLEAKDYTCTRRAMLALFQRYGLPRAIQVDNGPPFGGGGSLGLSRLSAEWLRLGIKVQFGRPACPQDNAAHERWHRTLQEDLATRLGGTAQGRLNRCLHQYNTDRAHESLGMRRPVEVYRKSRRRYRGMPPPRCYPRGWSTLQIGAEGRAWWAHRQRLFGMAFAQPLLGLRPVAPNHWEVYLDHVLIGLLVAQDRAGMRHIQLRPQHRGEGFALPSTPPTHLSMSLPHHHLLPM
ncbi:MAG TPA: helix-turn-helix domain-containing protein [Lacunisphaera sp.]|nr:helix-turn-helix domain-containing protein [Lacunisphaera sp.]